MVSKPVAALMERWYGNQINGTVEFSNLIQTHLGPGDYLLDLGCGAGKAETDFRANCALVVGCDPGTSVRDNKFISAGTRGDAYDLPFREQSFEVIVMDFVLEHLEFPDRCAREIFRVLKPGGRFLFRTPNFYHYVAIVASLTPHAFHERVVRMLADSEEAEPHRTFYRANTRGSLTRIFSKARLDVTELRMIEKEPYYLTFTLPTFLLGFAYERTVNSFQGFSGFRANVLGCTTKPRLNGENGQRS